VLLRAKLNLNRFIIVNINHNWVRVSILSATLILLSIRLVVAVLKRPLFYGNLFDPAWRNVCVILHMLSDTFSLSINDKSIQKMLAN
jgi:hypothetical protein